MRLKPLTLTLAALCAAMTPACRASDIVQVAPLTNHILMVHFNDGHVIHHRRGQPRSAETVITAPLDPLAAGKPASWSLSSADDPTWKTPQSPVEVGRKSKGTDFGWITEKWENNRAVNEHPDHTSEHWLYLTLPTPLRMGRSYVLNTGGLAKNGARWPFKYTLGHSRSEALHVNTLGYVPSAPAKYAYAYHWMGDYGSLDLKAWEGKPFFLLDAKTGKSAFEGRVRFRKSKTNPETTQVGDTPNGNFLGADVWECDFSAFTTPGRYVVALPGIGCSWPFDVKADVYRAAFRTVARGLYHNRSGIALTKPFTLFERPAPHNPKLTPGFAGKLRYTNVRWQEWGSEGGDATTLMSQSPGALTDTWGWYQDAGDWDSYPSHLRVARELLLAYEMAPRHFTDGELNIPESGNGIPDILDEAAWLPRFCHRLRGELLAKGWGTGGVGLRVSGDAFGADEKTLADGTKVGQGSWEDVARTWMVSGEDPWSTYGYAGAAAHLAYCYQLAGLKPDAGGVNWAKEARETYDWAAAHTLPGDEAKEYGSLRFARAYAAACLFRLTGDARYEKQLAADTATIQPDSLLWNDAAWAPYVYTLGGGKAKRDPALLARLRAAVLHTAEESVLNTPEKRALRWGGDFGFPMLIGQQTTPWVMEGAVAYTLTKKTDPALVRRYLAGLYTTCDYFLGTNTLNQTWVTGLGPRNPTQIFHMDAWYNGKGRFHPGLIPYGPWRKMKEEGQGPWDSDWANSTAYPAIDAWPGNERWFSNRCAPLTSEFTIHQNTAPAAAIFGFLCADASPAKGAKSSGTAKRPAPRRLRSPPLR